MYALLTATERIVPCADYDEFCHSRLQTPFVGVQVCQFCRTYPPCPPGHKLLKTFCSLGVHHRYYVQMKRRHELLLRLPTITEPVSAEFERLLGIAVC